MQRIRAALSFVAAAIAYAVPALLRDAMGLAGAALISYGARLVYEPVGYVVAGLFLVAFAWFLARKAG